MELRKKLISVAALAFSLALSAGVAISASAEGEQTMTGFDISATSIRLDDPNKEGVDSGLRFKVDCPTSDVEDAYTILTMTTSAGVAKTAKVHTEVWRQDNSGWNTVVANIPDTDYVTEITAQAFVTVNDIVYKTDAETSSIAKTASLVMNDKNVMDETLNAYVSVASLTLDQETATVQDGQSLQLTATISPAEYGVVWSSDNTDVATVDNKGKVTALQAGTANITASMGDKTATCAVTVKGFYEDFENAAVEDIDYLFWQSASGDAWVNVATAQEGTLGFGAGDSVAVPDNSSKMFVMWSGSATTVFAFTKDFMNQVFADTDVNALVFDVAFYSARTTVREAYFAFNQGGRVQTDIAYKKIVTSIVTRDNYTAWAGNANMTTFPFTITANGAPPLYIYIDNIRTINTIEEATVYATSNSTGVIDFAVAGATGAFVNGVEVPESALTIAEDKVSIARSYFAGNDIATNVIISSPSAITLFKTTVYGDQDFTGVSSGILATKNWLTWNGGTASYVSLPSEGNAVCLNFSNGNSTADFNVSKAYLNAIFADATVKQWSFDIQLHLASGSSSNKTFIDLKVGSDAIGRYFPATAQNPVDASTLGPIVTVTITRANYDYFLQNSGLTKDYYWLYFNNDADGTLHTGYLLLDNVKVGY